MNCTIHFSIQNNAPVEYIRQVFFYLKKSFGTIHSNHSLKTWIIPRFNWSFFPIIKQNIKYPVIFTDKLFSMIIYQSYFFIKTKFIWLKDKKDNPLEKIHSDLE